MKSLKGLLILAFLTPALLVPGIAFSADSGGNYAVWGVGKKSCFKYTKAREAEEYNNYLNYMKGFFTAFNMLQENTYSVSGKMTFNEILDWMDDYCETKQINALEQGLLEFVGDHEDSRLKQGKRKKIGR